MPHDVTRFEVQAPSTWNLTSLLDKMDFTAEHDNVSVNGLGNALLDACNANSFGN